MRRSVWFFVGLGIFAVLLFVLRQQSSGRFVWKPSFLHSDKNPFGMYVFDDVVRQSLKGSYTVSSKTLYQLSREKGVEHKGILLVGNRISLDTIDMSSLLSVVRRGAKVLLVQTGQQQAIDLLRDSIGIYVEYPFYFNLQNLRESVSSPSDGQFNTLVWPAEADKRFHLQQYQVPEALSMSVLDVSDWKDARVLAYNASVIDSCAELDAHPALRMQYPVAVSKKMGRGELVMVSTPLLFTNYGVLDSGSAPLVFRLLSTLGHRDVVRVEAYAQGLSGSAMQEERSPLSYFMSQRPLRWATWMGGGLLLAFMFFTARRRQRVIPVVKPLEDRSLEFVQLIGSLYYQQGNHADLLRKKYRYWIEDLRRVTGINLEDAVGNKHLIGLLAAKAGMPCDEVEALLDDLRAWLDRDVMITGRVLKEKIKVMNDFMERVSDMGA